jgi:shikimate dehydrogenase
LGLTTPGRGAQCDRQRGVPIHITGKTRIVGVIGWPVAHTLSPPMQNAALRALGLDWVYGAFPVAPEKLAEAIHGARALGLVGLNVTIPHKQAVPALMDELDPLAQAIGAVNTIRFTEDRTLGYNTDAIGYTRTVQEEGDFDFAGATVLQIGAGGVGRAMAAGAALAGAARVLIHARRPVAAAELAGALAPHFPATTFEAVPAEELEIAAGEIGAAGEQGLIANATPLGMHAGDALPLDEALIPAECTVFDTVYVPAETAFLQAARRRGAMAVGGLGMLARQGAQSLRHWTGLEPDEELMLRVLREGLQSSLRDSADKGTQKPRVETRG